MRTLVPEKAQPSEGTAVSTREIQNKSFCLRAGRGVGKVLLRSEEGVTNSQKGWCLGWLSLYRTSELTRVESTVLWGTSWLLEACLEGECGSNGK